MDNCVLSINGGLNWSVMSVLAKVTRGKVVKPYCVVVYGPSGVGKTTFAADFPSPIFLAAEDGSNNLDVSRLPVSKSLSDVRAAISELTSADHAFKTLVVDSLDWLEPLVHAEVCAKAEVSHIEEIPYGKGHIAALKLWQDLIASLATLRETKGMHLCLLAHAQVKSVNDPKETKTYDRYSLKLHEKASALFIEFADAVLFAQFEVFLKEGANGKTKALSSGARTLLTVWKPYAIAKSRYALTETLPLSFEAFDEAVNSERPEVKASMLAQVEALLPHVDKAVADKARTHLQAPQTTASLAKIINRLETLAQAKN
jgi:hypothetical protein